MKISVITVSYNTAATIADTLQSVQAQTHTRFEHLVIDGASTDQTVAVVHAWPHPSLLVSSEPDHGLYDAMNKGLQKASGDVIGFLNADDFFADDDVLARVAQAFADPDVEACYGDLVYVTADKQGIIRYWRSRPFVAGSFSKGWRPPHPTFYIRRSALERLGGFDLKYRLAADFDFMMRYLERSGIRSVYIPQVLVRMRVGGATNQSWRNIVQQNREILDAIRKNGGQQSLVVFWAHKMANQIWQRLTGRLQRASR